MAYLDNKCLHSPHLSPYLCLLPVCMPGLGAGLDGRVVFPALELGRNSLYNTHPRMPRALTSLGYFRRGIRE